MTKDYADKKHHKHQASPRHFNKKKRNINHNHSLLQYIKVLIRVIITIAVITLISTIAYHHYPSKKSMVIKKLTNTSKTTKANIRFTFDNTTDNPSPRDYMLQLATFTTDKASKDFIAKLKAKLTKADRKLIHTQVYKTKQKQRFRVQLGPYPNYQTLLQSQQWLQKLQIMSLIIARY